MSESNSTPDKPTDIESALRSLVPRKSAIDRDRLLYLAGQAAAEAARDSVSPRRLGFWRLATFVATAAALVISVVHFGRPEPIPQIVEKLRVVERIVYVTVPPKAVAIQEPVPDEVLQQPLAAAEAPDADGWIAAEFVSSRTLRLRHPAMASNVDQLPAARISADADEDIGSPDSVLPSYSTLSKRLRSNPESTTGSPFGGMGRFLFRLPQGEGDAL